MAERALPDVREIAVLRPNAVGDFAFALPCLHALKAAYPDARITYVGLPWHADFLRGRPGPVDAVEVLPPSPGMASTQAGHPAAAMHAVAADPRPLRAFISRMRARRFDLALQAYGGGRHSNPLLLQWHARLSAGMQASDARPLDRNLPYGPLQNRRLQLLDLAALVGARPCLRWPELGVTDDDRRLAAFVDAPAPLVLLQPGASDSRRRWPALRFAQVGDALAASGASVAINGSAQEAALVAQVAAAMRAPAIRLAGRLPLRGLCGLLERCALVVGNDTGPLHLACAIGTRCVGIYWLANLVESMPLSQSLHRALWSVRTHCPHCGADNLAARCAHGASFVEEVEVEDVVQLAQEQLSAWKGG